MSDINTKDLQKFLDTWSPILSVLPAVINSAERKAELERHVTILEQRLVAVQADTQAAADSKALQLAAANEQLDALRSQRAAFGLEVKEAEKAAKASVAEAKKAAAAKIAEHEAAVAESAKKVTAAGAALAARLAEVDAEVDKRKAEREVEIAVLEQRAEAAEATLTLLRSRIG